MKLTVQKLFSLIMEDLASGFLEVEQESLFKNVGDIYNGPEGIEIRLQNNIITLKRYNESEFKEIKPSELFQIISKELDSYFKK